MEEYGGYVDTYLHRRDRPGRHEHLRYRGRLQRRPRSAERSQHDRVSAVLPDGSELNEKVTRGEVRVI